MRLHLLALSALLNYVSAVNLYVASYSNGTWGGNISTLSLDRNGDSTYSLSLINTLNTSTNSPAWLTLDKQNNVLWLVDEAVNLTTNGTLVSYRTSYSGQLTELSRRTALVGGVHATFYGNGGALAVPHYTGSSLQTYNVTSNGDIQLLQTFNFTGPNFTTGVIADRQTAPHPHEAILDPTGQFVLIPDLGADAVHIFHIMSPSNELYQLPSLKTNPGYGPRHGAFSQDEIAGNWTFYLVGELCGNVTAYNVCYGTAGISFEEIAMYRTLPSGKGKPLNTDGSSEVAPAEIAVTPDGTTLIVSNRNDTSFGASPPTDSLVSYTISPADGTLTMLPIVSAGGSFPRQFAINRAGTLMAVGLQKSALLVILAKNATSGLFDHQVANITFPAGLDQPVCAVWDE